MKGIKVEPCGGAFCWVSLVCECGEGMLRHSVTHEVLGRHMVMLRSKTIQLECRCGSLYQVILENDEVRVEFVGNDRLRQIMNGPVSCLGLSNFITRSLEHANLPTVAKVFEHARDLEDRRHLGPITKQKIRTVLLGMGFRLGFDWVTKKDRVGEFTPTFQRTQ